MSGQNWRTETNALDYFGHQKKRIEIEQRRPAIRRAADVVGPGIGAGAIRITDFNSEVALYNGFFSGEAGVLNAPTDAEPFIGTTVGDAELGGQQTVNGLLSGDEYTRMFVRNPLDPASIQWSPWRGNERVPASAMADDTVETRVPVSTVPTLLFAPTITTIGRAGTYASGETDIFVLRPGVYTGYISLLGTTGIQLPTIEVAWPRESGTETVTLGPVSAASRGVQIPFTFWTTAEAQEIRVSAAHGEATPQDLEWTDIAITRVGDMA